MNKGLLQVLAVGEYWAWGRLNPVDTWRFLSSSKQGDRYGKTIHTTLFRVLITLLQKYP